VINRGSGGGTKIVRWGKGGFLWEQNKGGGDSVLWGSVEQHSPSRHKNLWSKGERGRREKAFFMRDSLASERGIRAKPKPTG